MFELEGATAEIAQAGSNVPGEAVMGLSKGISKYHDNMKTAKGQKHVRTGKIALMEYTAYLEAEREQQRVEDGLAPCQEGPSSVKEGSKYWPEQEVDLYFTVIITFVFDYCVVIAVAVDVYVLMVLWLC
jgi:hypothetical protein